MSAREPTKTHETRTVEISSKAAATEVCISRSSESAAENCLQIELQSD
jgi:hypothetical protein